MRDGVYEPLSGTAMPSIGHNSMTEAEMDREILDITGVTFEVVSALLLSLFLPSPLSHDSGFSYTVVARLRRRLQAQIGRARRRGWSRLESGGNER